MGQTASAHYSAALLRQLPWARLRSQRDSERVQCEAVQGRRQIEPPAAVPQELASRHFIGCERNGTDLQYGTSRATRHQTRSSNSSPTRRSCAASSTTAPTTTTPISTSARYVRIAPPPGPSSPRWNTPPISTISDSSGSRYSSERTRRTTSATWTRRKTTHSGASSRATTSSAWLLLPL